MYSDPHQRRSGNRLASKKLTIVRKLGDHSSAGPIAVFDQSFARMSAPISPPPHRSAGEFSSAAEPSWGSRRCGPEAKVTAEPTLIAELQEQLMPCCSSHGLCAGSHLTHGALTICPPQGKSERQMTIVRAPHMRRLHDIDGRAIGRLCRSSVALV